MGAPGLAFETWGTLKPIPTGNTTLLLVIQSSRVVREMTKLMPSAIIEG
jgi:hypothetical protein